MKPRRGLPRFFQREILPLDWPGAAPRFVCGSCDRTVRAGVVRCWRCQLRRRISKMERRWSAWWSDRISRLLARWGGWGRL